MIGRNWAAATAAGVIALYGLPALAGTDKAAVVKAYADIAEATFGDSLSTAKVLQAAIEKLVAEPSEANLAAARTAWIAARVPYQQSEVYRFGNAIVDDWEGKVNAWPLDEGLIDYVAESYGTESDENPFYAANVIANKQLKAGGETIDATEITTEVLQKLQEAGGVESNVAIGYHAIEFLLWGQDLNGTGPGAGNRPWTDYAKGDACTNGNCDRRGAYLTSATALLVEDLSWMADQWKTGGDARKQLDEKGADGGIVTILTGLGSLSYGELAGERTKLGLILHDPEEEQDCFSDNTHNSHYNDVVGMVNVYKGSYTRVDGSKVSGPSLSALVTEADAALGAEVDGKLAATLAAAGAVKARAEKTEHYDQMIGANNPEGNAAIQKLVDGLTDQTRSFERIITALKLQPVEFEGSDSLDNPSAVAK
ncbi:imelysin family protein [Zavarzinia aquatilis]|uniref:Peptidase n=1 Tax=Zavarzinia aquatilis TaxID=2211142 RepID=A0A317E385_9PROT|nr:imelysin family protein [Zavarzinia aquatilis]PWR21507.1 peptidase [Zavarzinia aquatilis]